MSKEIVFCLHIEVNGMVDEHADTVFKSMNILSQLGKRTIHFFQCRILCITYTTAEVGNLSWKERGMSTVRTPVRMSR